MAETLITKKSIFQFLSQEEKLKIKVSSAILIV